MSNLSDLLPAGASGKKAEFTASGAISTGDTVILNTDGTVSVVAAVAESAGTPTTFESGNTQHQSVCYMTENDKVLIAYSDAGNSNYGTAVVGTVSGTSITFGTPVVYWSAFTQYVSCAYSPPTDRVCVVFKAQTWGRNALLSVSGTTITVEHTENFYAANAGRMSVCFHAGNERFVVAVQGNSNSGYGYLYAATANGTDSLNWGGSSNFNAGNTLQPEVDYDPDEDVLVVFYRDAGNSNYGNARAATLSGTSFTYGTEITFESAQTDYPTAAYDTDTNQFVVAYRDAGDSFYPYVITIKASGTALTAGTAVRIATARSDNYGCVYDPVNQRAIVVVEDANDDPTAYVCKISGTDITVETSGFSISGLGTTGNERRMVAVYDPDEVKVVVPQSDADNSYVGKATVYQPPSTNAVPAPKFVGIAEEDIANAATGEVMLVGGISENATSEVTTTNSTVYLQADGSLSTTVTGIEAGLAFGALGAIGYKLSNAAYASKSLDVSSQDNVPSGIAFNSDGTKAFIAGDTNDTIYQYSLSTAYDISTATYDSVSFSVSSEGSARDLCFKPDGTKMLVISSSNDTIFQYSLSTGFDLSTASYDSVSLSIGSKDTNPQAVQFNDDGTSLYFVGSQNDTVYQYDMSSAYDLSTASDASKSFSVTSQEGSPQGLFFKPDGTKFYVVGASSDTVYQYSLSTAFDMSTASYDDISFDVSSEATAPLAVIFSGDGKAMYIADNSTDSIYQYTTQQSTTSKLLLNG